MIYIFLSIYTCLFQLDPENTSMVLTLQHLEFYVDRSDTLTFEQLYDRKSEFLKYDSGFVPTDYDPNAIYWIELDFCINDTLNNYILEFYDQTIDQINLYVINEVDAEILEYSFGDQHDFDNREFDHKNFEIILNQKGQYYVFARIKNREHAEITVAIKSINEFLSYALYEYYLYGIFYGMILIISLYNISVFSAIGEIKYLYYTFYILSVGLYAMCVDGIAFQMLWSDFPEWNDYADGIALFMIIFWAAIFSKKFLNLELRAPFINRFLDVVIIIRLIIFFYALFINHSILKYRFIEIVPLSIIFIGSIVSYKGGYKPARFFIIAYGFLFTGFLIKAFLMFSVVLVHMISKSQMLQIISYYSLHICFAFEMFFLSVALSDRIRILKSEKDEAFKKILSQQEENINYKDKLNQQLEENIIQRTNEIARKNELLEESNLQLSRQKLEISKINSMLDLDNWKLRNDLKYAQTERLLNKSLSYIEFIALLPDKKHCLKLLSEFKWNKGYSCVKCANKKYFNVKANYSRRCTKCGHNESATAETIFHGLKFPIQKALYILYTVSNEGHKSLQEISQEIDLRKNTVWLFQKKVTQYINVNGKHTIGIFNGLEQLSEVSE